MSSIDGITNPRTSWGATGRPRTEGTHDTTAATPTGAGTRSYGNVVESNFRRNLDTIFERGDAGEFDDPAAALREQAALARLRGGTFAATAVIPGAGELGVTVTTSGATGDDAIAAERELYAAQAEKSASRLANISGKLRAEYPLAASLASASTGTWDPATFRPKSREQAKAFAQRMAIDTAEAAARLDVLKAQLDGARLDAQSGASPEAQAQVEQLGAALDRQFDYVAKLAGIVDRASSGSLGDAGDDALRGGTLRMPDDVALRDLVTDMRAQGFDDADIAIVIGAGEVAIEEDQSPGGSQRLRQTTADMSDYFAERLMSRTMEQRAEEQKHAQRKDEQRIAADRRRDAKRRDAQRVEQRREQQTVDRQLSTQAAQRREADHRAFLQTLEAAARARSETRAAS